MDKGAVELAAAVAPHLDRLRLRAMRASADLGMRSGLLEESALDFEAFAVFAMLRNAYPDRVVPVRSYRAAYVYHEPEMFPSALARMTDAGLVDVAADSVALSSRGREVMARLRDVSVRAADGLWGPGPQAVLSLTDRCLHAAQASAAPGGAFHLVAPLHDEPGDSDAARLAERLTALRWHRFDAHVAAWSSAGLTAASVKDLAPGPVRDLIEVHTNELAGSAYEVLAPDERDELLAGLTRLSDG